MFQALSESSPSPLNGPTQGPQGPLYLNNTNVTGHAVAPVREDGCMTILDFLAENTPPMPTTSDEASGQKTDCKSHPFAEQSSNVMSNSKCLKREIRNLKRELLDERLKKTKISEEKESWRNRCHEAESRAGNLLAKNRTLERFCQRLQLANAQFYHILATNQQQAAAIQQQVPGQPQAQAFNCAPVQPGVTTSFGWHQNTSVPNQANVPPVANAVKWEDHAQYNSALPPPLGISMPSKPEVGRSNTWPNTEASRNNSPDEDKLDTPDRQQPAQFGAFGVDAMNRAYLAVSEKQLSRMQEDTPGGPILAPLKMALSTPEAPSMSLHS